MHKKAYHNYSCDRILCFFFKKGKPIGSCHMTVVIVHMQVTDEHPDEKNTTLGIPICLIIPLGVELAKIVQIPRVWFGIKGAHWLINHP